MGKASVEDAKSRRCVRKLTFNEPLVECEGFYVERTGIQVDCIIEQRPVPHVIQGKVYRKLRRLPVERVIRLLKEVC